tara:strand:- start:5018 stop:5821 length:804 start_codon:yes stop_codon:yes gene_type:complete
MLDIYIDENGNMHTFKGGALNVYGNILALLEEYWLSKKSDSIRFALPNNGDVTPGDIFTQYTIVRTPLHPNGLPLASRYERRIFYEPSGIAENIQDAKPNVLVLADYNKGALTSGGELALPEIDITIVDSRYRSLDKNWLSTSKLKLWHATADEYEEVWANDFDYTFWTDGPNPVKILKGNEVIKTLEVPKTTKVVNTCGSGDTFTATIAALMFSNFGKSINDKTIIEYAKYAIRVCQDVVGQPYTSTTKQRIQNVHHESRGSNTIT